MTAVWLLVRLAVLLMCGDSCDMNTVSFYNESIIPDVYYLLERKNHAWSRLATWMNHYIYAMRYDIAGNLYIGGAFTRIDELTVNYVAQWDGANWFDLDSGLNSYVRAMTVGSDNSLYVGGAFTAAGSTAIPANRVARWDGATWEALGTGVNGEVQAMTSDQQGNVYVGGEFTTAGGNAANCIAKWDGTSWLPLGSGMNGPVYALVVDDNGNLYAGGNFTTAGGVGANRIAKWDGAEWSPLGSGMNNSVYALAAAPDGRLFAGGAFTTAGGQTAEYLACWNGTMWLNMGSLNGGVFALEWHRHERVLYIAGIFDAINGISTINRLVKWSNGSFFPLSLDLFGNPTANSLASYENRLAFSFMAATIGDCKVWGDGRAVINNAGTVATGCRFVIRRMGGDSAKLTSIINHTAGTQLLFDWSMMDGETIIIDMTGTRKAITSSIRGNQLSKLLANSNFASFLLEPGVNDIGVYVPGTGNPTIDAYMQWENQFHSVDGAAQ